MSPVGSTHQLEEAVADSILTSTSPTVLLHAGHFSLDGGAGDAADDHLSGDVSGRPGVKGFVRFARWTWELACRVARRATDRGKRVELAVLVNDWQFLRSSRESRREGERHAAILRDAYYSKIPTIPSFHREMLERH